MATADGDLPGTHVITVRCAGACPACAKIAERPLEHSPARLAAVTVAELYASLIADREVQP